mmetsp:Transcript_32875/g.29744  ORF Transcript_32875/g.29744 Transcript_32875/m.29744 type:complete len:96 (+) Transcript_32875:493-780(+)
MKILSDNLRYCQKLSKVAINLNECIGLTKLSFVNLMLAISELSATKELEISVKYCDWLDEKCHRSIYREPASMNNIEKLTINYSLLNSVYTKEIE